MRIGLVVGLVCGLVAPGTGVVSVAVAQTSAKRPTTFADLMAMRRVGDPQVSVSGRWVLFSVTDVSLEKNSKVNHLWVVPMGAARTTSGDSSQERQVTFGTGELNGRFSPDGRWVMYSAANGEGTGEIFVAHWDDAAGTVGAGKAVTSLETEADGGVWAPDSRHFLFVSEVYPGCESKVAMGVGRNEAEMRCNAERDAAAAKSPVKAMLFTDLLYRHWDHYVGEKRSHIFYGDVGGAAPTDLTPASVVGDHVAPTFSLGGPLGYAISPDGREIAYEVNLEKVPAESTNNDIFVLQVGAEPGTARKVSVSLGSDDGPAYSPDGKWLAWRSQKRDGYESDRSWIVVYDRAKGTSEKLDMDLMDYSKPEPPTQADFDRSVDEFAWSDNSERLFFVCADHGEEIVYGTNFTGDDLHRFGKITGDWGSLVEVPGNAKDHAGEWVATYTRVNQPTEIVVVDPYKMDDSARKLGVGLPVGGGVTSYPLVTDSSVPPLTFLTHLNDALMAQLSMTPLEPFWFAGAGGTRVEGFVVKPPDFDAAKRYPVKFLIHGGPQGDWGDAWSYRWNPELFAADGYVVVMVNPRGSTGYGQRFLEEVSGDWGGRPFVDLMKGMDAAEAKFPFIDKTRECALGASYGGYMADWVLTHTDRFKCIVTHDGMYDPVSAFGATEELWFNEWEFRPLEAGIRDQGLGIRKDDSGDAVVEQTKPARPWDFYNKSGEFIGKPSVDDPFVRWSPMMFIKNAKTPTLVVHSQRDYRLDVSQGLQLFTALQLLGVPSEMLYFPDESHFVQKPQNSELWNKTVSDWCDRWVGMGKYAAVGAERNPMMESAK